MARFTQIMALVVLGSVLAVGIQWAQAGHHKDKANKGKKAHDQGFMSLTEGGDLSQWTTEGNWWVNDDNEIVIEPRKGEHGWRRFEDYLYTKKQYGDFILRLEYKLPKNGNSGVFFRIKDRAKPVKSGIEAQILDKTYGKADDKLGAHDSGGLIPGVAPSTNAIKPAGEWNAIKVMCKGRQIKVFVNGTKVVDVNMDDTPFKDRPDRGYIALQDHGLPLTFRNVEVKPLK
jgi:hypothetical protein